MKIITPLIRLHEKPLGCDTFIAFSPMTEPGRVIFGKNSDRPRGESQNIRRYPAQTFPEESKLKCTYLEIPQVTQTFGVLLSQIDWMWGAEMGANECGVVIGNEAVWTTVPDEPEDGSYLLGMDLVRLGLERGSTAKEAMGVVTQLLECHGQGGACAENDPSFTYDNSYIIADAKEAWILETAGRHWVAKRIERGGRNISNGLTIRTEYDLSSPNLKEFAKKMGLWNGTGTLDFAKCFSMGGIDKDKGSRQACGCRMLEKYSTSESFGSAEMTKILQDHGSGICMHGSFETTASMISEWGPDGSIRHWMTGESFPCQSEFKLQESL